jgi:aminoglycoside phosphotransferase (APT) family kinase protein
MNALFDQEQVRWFDFSEASVAHPLLDVGWLLAWLSLREPSTLPVLKEHPDLVEVLWKAYLDARGIKAAETTWQDVRLLALAHRLVAYEARLRSWKGTVPDLRPYVPYYMKLLLKFATA